MDFWLRTAGAIDAINEAIARAARWALLANAPLVLVPAGFLLLALQGLAEAIRCVASLRGTLRRPVHRRPFD